MSTKKITGDEKVGTGLEAERTAKDLSADYGWSIALLNSDPELRKLFGDAIHQGWTAARFTAELRDTKWLRTHGEAWRANTLKKLTYPQDWKDDVKAKKATIRNSAAAMGANLSSAQLDRITDNTLMLGWTDAQIQDTLGTYVKVKQSGTLKGQYIGDAGKNFDALTRLAKANGYKIPKGKVEGWLKEIAVGNANLDDYGDHIRMQAAKSYPAWADELMAGHDLEDLVSPYRSAQADLLEVPEDTIGFDDKLMKKAMGHRNAQGKPDVMALYDFEDQVRKDSRWQYTDNAHKTVLGAGQDVLKLMGFR